MAERDEAIIARNAADALLSVGDASLRGASFDGGAATGGAGMTPSDLERLARALPYGREHATSVPALMRALGWSDRQVREGLEQLVCEGLRPQARDPRRVPVVTLPTSPGVFVAETPEELELAIRGIRSRAMALLSRQRGLRLCREQVAYSERLF